jgi:hypothetical protein
VLLYVTVVVALYQTFESNNIYELKS